MNFDSKQIQTYQVYLSLTDWFQNSDKKNTQIVDSKIFYDEAHNLWIKHTDVKPDRVLRFGNKDNFWEMGDTGPCGPCSEIHYYTGELNNQKADGVNNLDNYRELWNLVFIEYNRESNGELNPLPSKHVDTGMGLERILATLNGIEDHYMTDLFHPIIKQIEQISGINYSDKDGMPHRVIADHLRMISFSIADGIMPSNEGRGYVVRRVLRRASRFGRVLNIEGPFLFKLIDALIISMGDVYSEISDKQKHIEKVVRAEEESFGKTLDRGLNLINKLLASSEEKVIPGKQVFTLYDTYGFPADLTQLIAKENNFDIDMNSFNDYMEKQKKLARSSSQFKNLNEDTDWKIIKNEESSFVGYTKTSYESQILKYRFIDDNIEIVMEETPFYAESGGQIGDTGKIFSDSLTLKVIDTYKNGGDICHLCEVIEGEFLKNTSAIFELTINEKRRKKIKSNHSATHLLHKSLKSVLGNHVQQAGSLVSDDKLRFDLTHYEKLTQNEILEIENNVNEYIMQNLEVDISNEKYDKAKKMGAEALFGEKYGDIVRVVNIGGSSIELCGGTHVERSGDIGFFKIISESALASGVRRVEAVTGSKAFSFVSDNMKVIDNIKQKLNCNIEDISNKIDSLIDTSKQNSVLEKQIQQIQIDSLLKSSEPNFSTNDKIDVYKSAAKMAIRNGYVKPEIISLWEEIVNPELAKEAVPEKLTFPRGRSSGGTLKLRAPAPLATELQHTESILLDRINSFFGYKFIKEIKLVLIKNKIKSSGKFDKNNTKSIKFKNLVERVEKSKLKKNLISLIDAFNKKNNLNEKYKLLFFLFLNLNFN